jgi:hypothetical protein
MVMEWSKLFIGKQPFYSKQCKFVVIKQMKSQQKLES